MSTDSPQTLRWWMDERRGELALTWQQVADLAGVSTETLYRAAAGRAMRTKTKKAIERALQWRAGSIDAVAAGGQPRPIAGASSPPSQPTSSTGAPPIIDFATANLGDLQREYVHFMELLPPAEMDRLYALCELYHHLQLRINRQSEGGERSHA